MIKHLSSFQIVHSRYATEALTIARKRGMTMRVVGQGDVPSEPFYKDQWWFEPVTSESTIPTEGRRRIEALLKEGVPIKGLVVAHEAPRLLTMPQEASRKPLQSAQRDNKGEILKIGLLSILGVLGAVLASVFLAFGYIFATAVSLDPALIAVLPDGTWLEVVTWYD